MKKILLLIAVPFMTCIYADPGIMIDIDIIFEKPSGPGGATLGAICN
jgi:hypothetical protein